VAVKRQLEFDLIQTPRPSKRQRCMPMCIPGPDIPSGQSYVGSGSSMFPAGMANGQSFMATSPNSHTGINKVTQNMQNRIYSYRRPRRLYPTEQSIQAVFNTKAAKQFSSVISSPSTSPNSPCVSPSSSPTHPSTSPSTSPSHSSARHRPTSSEDERIFSIKQVVDMCAKTLERTEQRLVQEYSQDLDARRKEQYDHFLRFVADNLRHDGSHSSYLS